MTGFLGPESYKKSAVKPAIPKYSMLDCLSDSAVFMLKIQKTRILHFLAEFCWIFSMKTAESELQYNIEHLGVLLWTASPITSSYGPKLYDDL